MLAHPSAFSRKAFPAASQAYPTIFLTSRPGLSCPVRGSFWIAPVLLSKSEETISSLP